MKYNKIVRDNIPEIIQSKNKSCDVTFVSDKEAVAFLAKKVLEEGKEFIETHTKEELADLYEVLDAIMNKKGWKKSEIDRVRNDKNKKNGTFKRNIILKTVHE